MGIKIWQRGDEFHSQRAGCLTIGIQQVQRRLAGLGQNDESLQMPIITNISGEAWGVKEAVTTVEDAPEWGDQEARGIGMEVSTAASCVVSGSNAIVVRHPESAKTIKALVAGLVG